MVRDGSNTLPAFANSLSGLRFRIVTSGPTQFILMVPRSGRPTASGHTGTVAYVRFSLTPKTAKGRTPPLPSAGRLRPLLQGKGARHGTAHWQCVTPRPVEQGQARRSEGTAHHRPPRRSS